MSLAQHIFAALDGTTVTKDIEELILKHKVLGFTLFKRNIESVEQVTELIKELKALSAQAGYEAFISVDHEGGRVFRLPEPFTVLPPMRQWGELFAEKADAEIMYDLGRILGSEVAAVGFDINFAPVVDIDINPDNPIIADRSFSTNAEIVSKCARLFIKGLQQTGVIGCLKHFPGHGATTVDSHLDLPHDERDADTIRKIDLLPYQRLIAEKLAPSIMTAHVIYDQIDDSQPATLSPKILKGILRDELFFDGIIFSDDFHMNAIKENYGFLDAAKRFMAATGDIILICKEPLSSLAVITEFDAWLKNDSASIAAKAMQSRLAAAKKRIQATFDGRSKPQARMLSELNDENREKVKRIFG